jgi:hypothetical protein
LLEGIGKITASGWRRERLSLLVVQADDFVGDLTELVEDLFLVWAMAAPIDEPGRYLRNTDLPPTTPQSCCRGRFPSCLRLLNGLFYRQNLVFLGVISKFAGNRHRFRHIRITEISVATLSSRVPEARLSEILYQFACLGQH